MAQGNDGDVATEEAMAGDSPIVSSELTTATTTTPQPATRLGSAAASLLGLFERPDPSPSRDVAANYAAGIQWRDSTNGSTASANGLRSDVDDATFQRGSKPTTKPKTVDDGTAVATARGERDRLRDASPLNNDRCSCYGGLSTFWGGEELRAVPRTVSWDVRPFSLSTDGLGESFLERLRTVRRGASRRLRRAASRISCASLRSLFIGATTSVLYHCVFSLAMASSITRRHAPVPTISLLGPMTKTTALGVVAASLLLIPVLGPEAPALYPSADLFLAPFLSQLGRVVDETLYQKRRAGDAAADDDTADDDTAVFLATFSVLASLGMLFSSALCILAARVKLANLGAFLPHAVICGFFSSIGVMVWTLSFSVDNSGAKIEDVLFRTGGLSLGESLYHHTPSVVAGVAMKVLCPHNPILLPVSIVCVVATAYATMFLTGTSLAEAQANGWFWTTEELIGERLHGTVGYNFGPPAPFGIFHALIRQQVDFDAVRLGLPTIIAMSLIYALRCSLHAVALKKLSEILSKKKSVAVANEEASLRKTRSYSRDTSVNVFGDVSFDMSFDDGYSDAIAQSTRSLVKDGGKKKLDNLRTLLWYGIGHLTSAIAGGFSAMPAFAVGAVLFELGVEGLLPQYGGIAILIFCYVTSFSIISYIPKAVFSSLLVLCFLDFIWKWFVQSYFKTKNIWEWLVVPAIVVVAFVVPLLEAVVLGVAASTFIFVGAFYGSGVVKFASTGLSIRSTVDRMDDDEDFLDSKGDLIQILVLQNYFFFGNASSCLQYILTMFEEPTIDVSIDFELPPMPKYIILDFTLVTGMDTSSVDIIAEIIALCKEQSCALLLSGLSKDFKSILSCGGVKPIPNVLLYCYDLDSALGKAEDSLLIDAKGQQNHVERMPVGEPGSGFLRALAQIETHQGISCVKQLRGLEKYTTALAVLPKQYLCGSDLNPNGGIVPESKRGFFFIEQGLLKIERDQSSSYSLTRNLTKRKKNVMSLGQMNARSATVGKLSDLLKATKSSPSRPFRLAKIGPGWVIGAVEGCSGLRNPGLYYAVTKCRLYHIPYSELGRIEEDDPLLALNLFKLLAHIVSRRQISAIEQLGNLHSIITSPPVTQARGRVMLGAINSAVQFTSNN